nr:cytochrome c1-2, heme protein, mitochondrial [Tanacetum cinerariifolium]
MYNFVWALSTSIHSKASPALSSLISKKDQDGAGSAGVKSLRAIALIGARHSRLLSFTTIAANDAENGLECPSYPWPHQGILSSYDHASLLIPPLQSTLVRAFLVEGKFEDVDMKADQLQSTQRLVARMASPALSSLISKKDQDGAGSAGVKSLRAIALIGARQSRLLSFTTIAANDAENGLECPSYPWPHQGILSSYDHAS